jgi:DDE family transposase
MTDVACFAATTGGVPDVTMTSTFSRTNSAANSARCSMRPSAQRYSIATLRPSIQPSSCRRCTKALTRWLSSEDVLGPKNPMVGSFGDCCARAARGHMIAAPPRRVISSRRLTPSPQPPKTNCRGWPETSICGRIPAAEAAQRRRGDKPAMNEDIPLPFDLPAVARKKVSTAFDGGRITSDGGVMLLAQAERRLGIADRLARVIPCAR